MPEQKPEKPSQMLAVTPEMLQDMLKALSQSNLEMVKAFIDESRKPTHDEIVKKEKQKEYWKQLEIERRMVKEARENACRHIHPHANKSLFFRFEVCAIEGGWMMTCSRCGKVLTNYDPENNKLILNPEFEKWWPVPNLTEGGLGAYI